MSLVTRHHEACFVSWLSPLAALMRQRVNTDQADRFIAITPWRTPRTDFNAATVIWPNAGTRGDRRVDKTSRMPAPTHPMRVVKMMSVAFADGVTKDPCLRCGSFSDQAEASRRTSEDNPIRTRPVCLLTFHNACLEATKTYRDSVKFPTPLDPALCPLELLACICSLCKSQIGMLDNAEVTKYYAAGSAGSPAPGADADAEEGACG